MKEQIGTLFVQIVIPALFTVLAAVVAWGGKRLVAFIDAKTKNTLVAGILTRLTAAVQTVVLDVNGTVKAAYLEAAKDGVLTDDEKTALKRLAIERVKMHLGKLGLTDLIGLLGLTPSTLDDFLGSHIEAAIEGMKTSSPVVLDPAPAPVPAIDLDPNP